MSSINKNPNGNENDSGHQSNDGFYTTFIKESETIQIDCFSIKLKKVKPNGFVILVQAPKEVKISKVKNG